MSAPVMPLPGSLLRVVRLSVAVSIFAWFLGCGGGRGAPAPPDGSDAAGASVVVVLNAGTRYQVMRGFGASSAYYTNWLTEHPHRDEIYRAIFADLGIQILRIGNWYENSTGSAFDDSTAIAVAARAWSGGAGALLLLSSWSPPASLKSNGSTKGGGSLASVPGGGGYRYAEFGQWWKRSLDAYAAAGASVDYVSIQNEPDFLASYESCAFDPSESATHAGYERALEAVYTAIGGADAPAQLIGPEVSGIGGSRVESYLAALGRGAGLTEIGAIAHHLYNGGTATVPSSFNAGMAAVSDAAGAAGKPLFMTEYSPSDGPDMFNTAWLIQNAVTVEGVAAYLYWGLTWAPPSAGRPPGGLVTTENPFDRAAWTTANGYTVNDAYYAVRHFSRWTATGWQRVAIEGPSPFAKASAFVSPDGLRATLVLLNTDSDAHAVSVDTGGFEYGSSAVYRTSTLTDVSGAAERTSAVGPLAGPIFMPAHAIATVTLSP